MAMGSDYRELGRRQPAAHRPQVEGPSHRARVDAGELQEQSWGVDHRRRRHAAPMILCRVLAGLLVQAPAHAPAIGIDWPAFLARHDLVWPRLPNGWGESAFIGNGRLGATIDVRDSALGWTINRTDVVHDQSRYPIGRVILRTAGAVQGGTARLTLWDAEASGTVTTDRGAVRWRSFTSARPSVIV